MRNKVKHLLCTVSPELATRLMYFYNFRKWLNLKRPQGLNEKLQYLKLKTYYNNPTITQCVDKLLVRDYLRERGYTDILPELVGGGYCDPEDIRKDWERFPNKFVIKCNHGCGYNVLVTDKDATDLEEVINQLKQWMKEDFWKQYCEPQYKFVPKRIHVEEYLGDSIQTYKFYCFNGEPHALYVSSNGENGEKDLYLDYFDMEWNWLPVSLHGHLHAKQQISKPENFEGMVALARDLAQGFPFVRVDLYNIKGTFKFSEFTFIPTGGNMKLDPPQILEEWGKLLQL